jgi:hypothetical protein
MVDYPSEALAVNLSSKTLRGIIPLLALRPGEGHTLTELARFAGVDTKSVWQTLHQLQADGALLASEYGRKTYSINPRYEFYAEIRPIAFRLLGVPQALDDSDAGAALVVLFGSVLREVYRRESDIDLLVVARDEPAVQTTLAGVSERLGKRVTAVVYTPGQFVERWNSDDSFIADVFAGPHAVLGGSLERLGLGAVA